MIFTFKSRIWTRYLLMIICLAGSGMVNGQDVLQLGLYHQRDSQRAFSGIEGLNVQQIDTGLMSPLFVKPTHAGLWALAAHVKESRFNLSGITQATRRFYRFSVALDYQPRQVGRWQYRWHIEPSHYADESIFQQKRLALEFETLAHYRINKRVAWVVGARQDSRFGDSRIYPVFGLQSRPNKKWHHHWVFPDIYSEYRLKPKTKARLFTSPSGGSWRYLEADSSIATFGINGWNIGLKFQQKTKSPFELSLELGTKILGEGSVAGQKGNLDNAYYIKIMLGKPIRF